MKKLYLLLVLLAATAHAKIEIAQSEVILEKTLQSYVDRVDKLVIKAFDADDEEGRHLDKAFEKDSHVTLLKVPYESMKGTNKWQERWFGEDFQDRDTVYSVYKKGKRVRYLHPHAFKTPGAFKARVKRLLTK